MYMETSAKTGGNVDDAFHTVVEQIYNHTFYIESGRGGHDQNFNLSDELEQDQKAKAGGCCG